MKKEALEDMKYFATWKETIPHQDRGNFEVSDEFRPVSHTHLIHSW
jgi:hypothetical protein